MKIDTKISNIIEEELNNIIDNVLTLNESGNENGLIDKPKFNLEDVNSHDGIAAWIYNKDDNTILTQWHNKFGFWTIPIGKVKDGDSHMNTLKIEMWEELGIKVKSAELIGSFDKTYYRKLDGEDLERKVETTQFMFVVKDYENKIYNKEPNKHRELRWFTLDELSNETNVSDAIKLGLDMFKKYLKKVENE